MSEKRIPINKVLDELNTIIDIDRICPKEDSSKVNIEILKTIGLQLNPKQALELVAYLILAASAGWKVIDITGYRIIIKNSEYKLTVTTKH